jgi:peptidyl-dipeptidase A
MRKWFLYFTIIFVMVAFLGNCSSKENAMNWQKEADSFLKSYLKEFASLEKAFSIAYWEAANKGKKEDFEKYSQADLELKKLHSDTTRYQQLAKLLDHKDQLDPLTVRSVVLAELRFKESQLPRDLLSKLVSSASEIEQIFTTFRGNIDGKEYSDNELIEVMGKENDSLKRQKIWQAMKQVGAAVAPKLIKLAGLRNEAAKKLGYENYWEMKIYLEEHNPQELLEIFAELEKVTDEPFKQMKNKLDSELAQRFKIKPEEMMPWHYNNPFFQAAPPSDKINLDEFYRNFEKEKIVELAKTFYADLGLPVEDILQRSDLFERDGKNQHAFSTAIDRQGDVRILTNLSPTAEQMDTLLHELGHAVYSKHLDFSLPFNVREVAHAFTTEAVAMLFGALAKNPTWMMTYAGANEKRVKEMKEAILEQRRREQLIFARWSMVMFYFEKALYTDPHQYLNKTWWDLFEQLQLMKRPEGRNSADWASKIHFSIAPVYYHKHFNKNTKKNSQLNLEK